MGRLRYLRSQGLPGLLLSAALSIGLYHAPENLQQQVRATVRDGLSPGAHALLIVRDQYKSMAGYLQNWSKRSTAVTSSRQPSLAREDEVTDLQIRHLEIQVAELKEQLARARSGLASPFLGARTPPLIVPEIVSAVVIGRNSEGSRFLAERLINQGTEAGLAAHDPVIETPLLKDLQETLRPLWIDQGENALVQRDQPVIAGCAMIGRIHQVGRHTSTVQLVTDPDFRVGAQIIRTTSDGPVYGASGLWEGTGQAQAELRLIDATEPVSVGDRVYSTEPVAGTSVPLLLGTITRATLQPGTPHWKIEVDPTIRELPDRVQVVRVGLNQERFHPLPNDSEIVK